MIEKIGINDMTSDEPPKLPIDETKTFHIMSMNDDGEVAYFDLNRSFKTLEEVKEKIKELERLYGHYNNYCWVTKQFGIMSLYLKDLE